MMERSAQTVQLKPLTWPLSSASKCNAPTHSSPSSTPHPIDANNVPKAHDTHKNQSDACPSHTWPTPMLFSSTFKKEITQNKVLRIKSLPYKSIMLLSHVMLVIRIGMELIVLIVLLRGMLIKLISINRISTLDRWSVKLVTSGIMLRTGVWMVKSVLNRLQS